MRGRVDSAAEAWGLDPDSIPVGEAPEPVADDAGYSSSISGSRPEEVARIARVIEMTPAPPPLSIAPYVGEQGEMVTEMPEAPQGDIHDAFTLDATSGIYRMQWPSPVFVVMEVDLLRQERGGDMSGEVTVRVTAPGLERTVHTARSTITGTRARSELANHLAARGTHLDKAAWLEIIERAFVRVIQAYREGEPPIYLWQAKRPQDDDWSMEPLAHSRLATIIFGDGGSAKSWIALAVAASLTTGTSYIEGMPVSGQRNVAYLDWEMDAWSHMERVARIVGRERPDILYLSMTAPLRESVDRLRRVAREYDIGYWIVDSAALACGGEPESAEVATAYFNALRAIGGSSLTIAHITKDAEGSDRKPFGSVFWHNTASFTYGVKGVSVPGRSTVGLFNRKNRTEGLREPFSITLDFEDRDGPVTLRRASVEDAPELAGKVPLWRRIRPLLEERPRTIYEITESLGATGDAVRMALRRDPGVKAIEGDDRIERWTLADGTGPNRP